MSNESRHHKVIDGGQGRTGASVGGDAGGIAIVAGLCVLAQILFWLFG